jgi:hypothetical protein
MDNYLLLFFCGSGFLVAAVIVVLYRYYRKTIKIKEQDIVYHIHEQDRLSKELEYVNVEKKVMEKMLEAKIDAVVLVTPSSKRDTPITNRRERKNH